MSDEPFASARKDPQFLYLRTIGRTSGLPREIEIWFVDYEGCYYLCAETREQANWVQNIRRNPQVWFWVNGQTYRGTGRVVDAAAEPDRAAAVSALFDRKYEWSNGLLVELCPEAAP
ncbi:MAG: nitroreductase family deazaflavin-dependent oxidoreductase [Chloroflexi bacterium]|nr:nitroreductase family deazaflavin-dependent oxidoreductase [Chloroflexota bacterium]